jgi:uncharacterized membrane protein
MDHFTEVTHQGILGRLGNSIKGIVVGGGLLIASFPILFVNEGCAVKDFRRLTEARKAAVEVPSDSVSPENEGRLLVVSGEATTDEEVEDPDFDVRAKALRLEREVVMYQWDEDVSKSTEKKVGGGETTTKEYSYEKKWSEGLKRSSDFKRPDGHRNPTEMPFESAKFQAKEVLLGAFQLPQDLVSKISGDEPLPLTDADLQRMPPAILKKGIGQRLLAEAPEDASSAAGVSLVDGALYLGQDPDSPVIGDVRVAFETVLPSTVTVRSEQRNQSFTAWSSSTGAQVHEIRMGTLSAKEMNAKAVSAAKIRTWLVRLGGFFAMGLGLSIILGPLSVVLDVVPFLGSMVRGASALVAFVLAALMSLVVIAIAWFTYRPLLSIPLLVVAAVLGWWLSRRGQQQVSPTASGAAGSGVLPPMTF